MNYLVLATLVLLVGGTQADDVTPNPLCPFPSDDYVRFPFQGDCSKYWECFQGQRYPMSCPDNLEFNAEKEVCDFPDEANCDRDATVTYPTFTPGSTTTTTPGTGPTSWTPDPLCPYPSNDLTYFAHPTNCSLYYECFQGMKYLMACPPGLVFNLEKYYCDFPENVDCSRTSTTGEPVSTTTPISPTNATTSSGTTGTPATTSSTATPATTLSTATPDNPCADQEDGTFLADPADCSKFFECLYGKTITGQCGIGLLWNEDKKTCDYAENVVCNT